MSSPERRATGAAGSRACVAGGRAHDGSPSTGGPNARLRAHDPERGTSRPCGPAYRPRRRGSGGGGGTGRWLRSVHPTTAGAAGIAAGTAGGLSGGETAAAGGVRGERRDLLAKIRLLALGAQVRLPTVQDDGFEAMAAVVAPVFEDGHEGHYRILLPQTTQNTLGPDRPSS